MFIPVPTSPSAFEKQEAEEAKERERDVLHRFGVKPKDNPGVTLTQTESDLASVLFRGLHLFG